MFHRKQQESENNRGVIQTPPPSTDTSDQVLHGQCIMGCDKAGEERNRQGYKNIIDCIKLSHGEKHHQGAK
jgi:hypothetical protein